MNFSVAFSNRKHAPIYHQTKPCNFYHHGSFRSRQSFCHMLSRCPNPCTAIISLVLLAAGKHWELLLKTLTGRKLNAQWTASSNNAAKTWAKTTHKPQKQTPSKLANTKIYGTKKIIFLREFVICSLNLQGENNYYKTNLQSLSFNAKHCLEKITARKCCASYTNSRCHTVWCSYSSAVGHSTRMQPVLFLFLFWPWQSFPALFILYSYLASFQRTDQQPIQSVFLVKRTVFGLVMLYSYLASFRCTDQQPIQTVFLVRRTVFGLVMYLHSASNVLDDYEPCH